MADVLATGMGTVTGTLTTAQVTLLSAGAAGGEHSGLNFVSLKNLDTTNFLFAKAGDDPGCFLVAGPGDTLTIARGPECANNITKVIGYGADPNNSASASVKTIVIAKKIA